MKHVKAQAGFAPLIFVIVGVVLIGVVGFAVFRATSTSNNSTPNVASTQKKGPGIITTEQFSASLNSDGSASHLTNQFAPTEPKIYVVMSLTNAKKNTRLQYIRYINGKYLGHGSIAVGKDNAKNASFTFTAKPGKSRPKGTYKLKVYSNGHLEMAEAYTIK